MSNGKATFAKSKYIINHIMKDLNSGKLMEASQK